MCRIVAFLSNAPSSLSCELIHSENSLVTQSIQDELGRDHKDGWGIGVYKDGKPEVVREISPASISHIFKNNAQILKETHIFAHVRRATFGKVFLDNTHPFTHGKWMFMHNGTLDAISKMRDVMLSAMTPEHRNSIKGTTDSEHIFHYILSYFEQHPEMNRLEAFENCIHQMLAWSDEVQEDATKLLTLLLTDGKEIWGSRIGRTLWYHLADKHHSCEHCIDSEGVDTHHDEYKAITLASEKLNSSEGWVNIPDNSVFHIEENAVIEIQAMKSFQKV